MPLKEDDLKTFEAYKKAMKQKVTKITTSGNTKFWIYRDVELPTAAGKKQKLPAFIALLDDRPVKKLVQGKMLLCKGLCGLEGGKIAFEPSKGKVPYKPLRTSVPLLFGKMLYIPPTASEEDEGEEVENDESPATSASAGAAAPAPQPPSPETTGPNYAQLNAAWKELIPKIQEAAAADPARKAALQSLAAPIPDMLRSGQLSEARLRIEKLKELVRIPAAPPPPPPGSAPNYAQLNSTWKGLIPAVQQAIAADPSRKPDLQQAAAGIPDLLQSGQLGEAQKRIEKLQQLLKIPPAPPPPPRASDLTARWNQMVKDVQAAAAANPARKDALTRAAAGIPDLIKANNIAEATKRMDALADMLKAAPAAPGASELAARWNGLVKRIQAELAAHPEKKADITRAGAGIPDMIKAGKLDLAARLMDGVDAVLNKGSAEAAEPEKAPKDMPEKPGVDAQGTGPANEPEIQKQWAAAKQTWRGCIETVDGQIGQVRSQMVSSGDPDFKLIADRGLPALTENHKTPVMRALFELDGPPGGARKSAAAKAQAAITAFRGHIRSSELLQSLDEHAQVAFGVQMTLRAELERGLSALEQAVRLLAAN